MSDDEELLRIAAQFGNVLSRWAIAEIDRLRESDATYRKMYAAVELETERLRKLQELVRRILSQINDDHCHLDWGTLYPEMAALVGMSEWKPKVLDRETMLRNCGYFVDCLLSGEHYEMPSITEEEAAKLRTELAAASARIEELLKRDWEREGELEAKAAPPRPAAPAWTHEPPTEPGWYWYRRVPSMIARVACVPDVDGIRQWEPSLEWAGPIPEPIEKGN